MDPTKFIPAPPTTADPVTWIALAAFCVGVVVFLWVIMFGAPKAMTALREERERALAKFSEEQDKQRAHDATRTAALHEKLDEIKADVATLVARS